MNKKKGSDNYIAPYFNRMANLPTFILVIDIDGLIFNKLFCIFPYPCLLLLISILSPISTKLSQFIWEASVTNRNQFVCSS